MNQKSAAIAFGTFAAVMHLIWVVIVAAGFGQAWVNWKMGIHFLQADFKVMAFDPVNAVVLIVAAFVFGAIFGWLFATIWNWAHKG